MKKIIARTTATVAAVAAISLVAVGFSSQAATATGTLANNVSKTNSPSLRMNGMNVPTDRMYSPEHLWVKKTSDGSNIVTVGMTDYYQYRMGYIVFVDLSQLMNTFNESLRKGDTFVIVESVAAIAELFMPVSGKIVRINEELNDFPSTINESPYGAGWILQIEMDDPSEYDVLVNPWHYEQLLNGN